jgi:hypothetical protein
MWIALNNAFLSIVQPKQHDYARYCDEVSNVVTDLPNSAKHMLAVRARSKADLIAAVGPTLRNAGIDAHKRIVEWPHRDYPARIFLPRAFVANMIAAQVRGIGYTNFKDSVKSNPLHDAYNAVWSVMHRYGRGEFNRKPARGSRQHPGYFDDIFPADTLDPFGPEGELDYSPPRSAHGMTGK